MFRLDRVLSLGTLGGSAGSPQGRNQHVAVWTGYRMIVWGGQNAGRLKTGAIYNTGGAGSWTAMSTTDAPLQNQQWEGVWIGDELLVWGLGLTGAPDGGRYNLTLDRWSSVTQAGAPRGRSSHTLVWTGEEALIYGGMADSIRQSTVAHYRPSQTIYLFQRP